MLWNVFLEEKEALKESLEGRDSTGSREVMLGGDGGSV